MMEEMGIVISLFDLLIVDWQRVSYAQPTPRATVSREPGCTDCGNRRICQIFVR